MYPPVYYHTEYFHCPKNLLCSPISSLHPLLTPPLAALIFLLSFNLFMVFLFQNVTQLESDSVYSLLRFASFT